MSQEDATASRRSGRSAVMGGLVPDSAGEFAYASVHGPISKRGGKFRGKLVVKTEMGMERLINQYADTSWKGVNDELRIRRLRSEKISALIHDMSVCLEAAKDQKERQDMQRMDSSFVILYNRERLIGDRPEIAVSVKSVGWNSMQAAQLGYEGDMLPLGPAEDGDEIIVKRGIVKINAPIYLDCDLTFSREKNYAGGGGGGWSGGGGGGYGLGGGGGGGTFVIPGATNLEIKVGTQYKKGHEVVVGNVGDGAVSIREPIMGDEWHFKCIQGAEEFLPPRTCIYIIQAMGGAGASVGSFKGGTGAAVEAMFHLEENEPVILVCGKMGETFEDRWGMCGGGGGATCVFDGKMDPAKAFIVAGGGGGSAAPVSSKGSDGGHANTTLEGNNGFGTFHGDGGQDGHAGTTRHIRTCFLDSAGGCARFMSEDKVKLAWEQNSGYFAGAGSGILEFALGSAAGASRGDIPKEPGGVAAGGFGGGGCGDWHPEETRIEGHCVDAIFHCRAGNPVIRDQVLTLSGHVPGADFQPQCILVDGGRLLAEQIDMVCHEGNACVSKFRKKSRHDSSPAGHLTMNDCSVNNCGGNGLLVLDGASLEANKCRLTRCKKDGVDVKGKGSTALVCHTEILETGARAVIVSKGGDVTVMDSKIDKSQSSGCVAVGQGSVLKLQRCLVNAASKSGVMVSDGAYCELRKCNVVACHDVGILAIGVEDKILDEETKVRVVHCVLKKNAYGVWAQDGAVLKLLGGIVTDSVHQDITQHTQPNMKTANNLVSLGSQLRVVFVTWKKEAQTSKALQHKLQGLSNEELDVMIDNVFAEFDQDGSGEINAGELGEALESLGVKLNDGDIQHRLNDMDENNDGLLSLNEFKVFCYNLVSRKRGGGVPAENPATSALLQEQRGRHNVFTPGFHRDQDNEFQMPQKGCAIVIRAILPELQRLCTRLTRALNPDTQQHAGTPYYDAGPLAFSTTHAPDAEAAIPRIQSQFRVDLNSILQECQEGEHRVSEYFHGSCALTQALQDAEHDDVVLVGPGRHLTTECEHIEKSIGICALPSGDEGGAIRETEICCKTGEIFEISKGNVIFVGLFLSKVINSPTSSTLTCRGGNVVLQGCTLTSSSGCSILCAVESIDCNVTCSDCQFVNGGNGQLALVAKDGAVATLDSCQLVGSTLYATSGGLIHIDATQLVESVNDSIIVDCDGVVKARNSKVIGSLQNGITVTKRGMLTMYKCHVIRSQKIGLLCAGSCSTIHVTESIIREGWSNGVHIFDGAQAEFEQCGVLINKGTGCLARGAGVTLRLVDTMVSSNVHDGLVVEDGASVDMWSMLSDIGEGAMLRQNGWCGMRVRGKSTSAKCSQATVKCNGLHGLIAEDGAIVTARLLQVDTNTGTGILAMHATTVINLYSCTSTGNRVGLASTQGLIRANHCRVVRNMCNVLEEESGRVQVDIPIGAHRATSEVLPRIEVSRSRNARPTRPATPLKKSGERGTRRRSDASSDAPMSPGVISGSSLPPIASSPVEL